MSAILAASAGLGALNNIYAGYKNAQAVKEKKAAIEGLNQDNQMWYDQQYNQDFLGTNVASAALEKARENLLKSNQQAENTAAVTGATNENLLASKTKNQAQYGDMMSNLAAMGTARKDSIDNRYQNQKMTIAGLQLNEHDADIASAQHMQGNAGKIMGAGMDIAAFLEGAI